MMKSKILQILFIIFYLSFLKCVFGDSLKILNPDFREADKYTQKDLPFFDARLDPMPDECYRMLMPHDCATATTCTKRSGIYKIQIEKYSNESFYVLCDDKTDNGDWLLIQRRQDGSEDFYRNWIDYGNGFGDIDGEFFIGLKKLYALTHFNGPQELLIIMESANGTKAYAKYENFAIGDASELYKLKRWGRYSGTAGNSLQRHMGMKFTTKDRSNDISGNNCAVAYKGAWWYEKCHDSNLNGKYGDGSFGVGINWRTFCGYYESLTYVKMMIRRARVI